MVSEYTFVRAGRENRVPVFVSLFSCFFGLLVFLVFFCLFFFLSFCLFAFSRFDILWCQNILLWELSGSSVSRFLSRDQQLCGFNRITGLVAGPKQRMYLLWHARIWSSNIPSDGAEVVDPLRRLCRSREECGEERFMATYVRVQRGEEYGKERKKNKGRKI